MADVNKLWQNMRERLTIDEMEDVFHRLFTHYNFAHYIETSMVYADSRIERVIFNPPATIILWNDGTKSVVKCQNGEPFDAEKGFALAYLKKLLGNDNTFNKEIKKWVKWEEPVAPTATVAPVEPVEEETIYRNIKFNDGDYARIIREVHGHLFDIGTVVKLRKSDYDYYATDDNGVSWWVCDEELEEVF